MSAERVHLDRGRGWGVGWDPRLGRGHQSSGDQLWFGINLCRPVIGPRQPGAVTPPAHWSAPALICVIGCLVASSDLPGKIFDWELKNILGSVLTGTSENIWNASRFYSGARVRKGEIYFLSWFGIWSGSSGLGFGKFGAAIWATLPTLVWRADSYNKTNILHTHFISQQSTDGSIIELQLCLIHSCLKL